MVDCCSSGTSDTVSSSSYRRPKNGIEYRNVSAGIIAHHLNQPWQWLSHNRSYCFRQGPEYNAVRFSEDGVVILKSQIHARATIKPTSKDTLVCYRFGITKADALNNPDLRILSSNRQSRGFAHVKPVICPGAAV